MPTFKVELEYTQYGYDDEEFENGYSSHKQTISVEADNIEQARKKAEEKASIEAEMKSAPRPRKRHDIYYGYNIVSIEEI